jgi:hypothetical protein
MPPTSAHTAAISVHGLTAIRTRGATTCRFTLVRRDHGYIAGPFAFVVVDELLFKLKASMDVGRTVGSRGGANDNGVCNVVTHVRKVVAHCVEHQDGEKIFFFGDTNGVNASCEVCELSAGKSEAFRTFVA